jgi:flagellar motor switch protein FliM
MERVMTEMESMTHTAGASAADPKLSENLEMPWMSRIEEHPGWSTLSRLAVTMTVEIPLVPFKVQDLLGLKEGQVFQSASPDTEDVPLKVGDVQLGWTEFEVVEQRIALRLTRLV